LPSHHHKAHGACPSAWHDIVEIIAGYLIDRIQNADNAASKLRWKWLRDISAVIEYGDEALDDLD